MQNYFIIVFLVIFYFRFDYCVETAFIKFLINYLSFVFHLLYKFTCSYFNYFGVIECKIRSLIFINIIPVFIQFLLLFHFTFYYVWNLYLLMSIYLMAFSLPYYCFLVINGKKRNMNETKNKLELKFKLLVAFFVISKYYNLPLIVPFILLFDLVKMYLFRRRQKK